MCYSVTEKLSAVTLRSRFGHGFEIRENRSVIGNIQLSHGSCAKFIQEFSSVLNPVLMRLIADILSVIPSDFHLYFTPDYINEINPYKKAALEKLLGRKISNEAFAYYCTQEGYEQQMGLGY